MQLFNAAPCVIFRTVIDKQEAAALADEIQFDALVQFVQGNRCGVLNDGFFIVAGHDNPKGGWFGGHILGILNGCNGVSLISPGNRYR